jgi:hypothetical protein
MSDCDGWQDEFDSMPDQGLGGDFPFRVVTAELAALPPLLEFVHEQGQRAALQSSDAARLAVVVEELFMNSVSHGFPPAMPGMTNRKPLVRLAMGGLQPGVALLDYRDRGVAFNPLADGPVAPDSAGEIEQYLSGRLGGVGLWLLRQYAQDTAYARFGGVNRLRFQMGGDVAAQ